MYDYRTMSPQERQALCDSRRKCGVPLHAPPHLHGVAGVYLVTAACYEHRRVFEQPDEISWLAEGMQAAFDCAGITCAAWVFLPNHYHVLVLTEDLKPISELLRKAHSRIATRINARQRQRGRQVWYRFSDRLIRSESHHDATVNYIHFNPVKHGYVDSINDWPWSSYHEYVGQMGAEWLAKMWKDYPIGDYGRGWDW